LLNILTVWCSYFTNILYFGVQDALKSKKDLDNCGTSTSNEVGVLLFPNLLSFVAATVLSELGMMMLHLLPTVYYLILQRTSGKLLIYHLLFDSTRKCLIVCKRIMTRVPDQVRTMLIWEIKLNHNPLQALPRVRATRKCSTSP
jgi:hypothetical protein